jgi:hypothetical protein
MSSYRYQKTKKPSSSLTAEIRSLVYFRMLLERMGFRIMLLKGGSVGSTVMVEHRQHGFCGITPKPITLPTPVEK